MFVKMERSLEMMTCRSSFFLFFLSFFIPWNFSRCNCGQLAALHESNQDQKKNGSGWDPKVNITVRKCDSFGEILFRDILTGIKKNSMVRQELIRRGYFTPPYLFCFAVSSDF